MPTLLLWELTRWEVAWIKQECLDGLGEEHLDSGSKSLEAEMNEPEAELELAEV